MSRDVKIRVSYHADAAYLTRLARAVELDTKRPAAWKRGVIARLNEIIIAFLKAREENNG